MELKRTSPNLERTALWFVTQRKPSSYKLLSQINESHFGNKVNLAAFKRLKFVNTKRNQIMSWADLCEDTAIPEQARSLLEAFDKPTEVSKQRAGELYNKLEEYRKRRVIYDVSKEIIETKLLQNADIDEIINDFVSMTTKARSPDQDDDFFVIGRGGNTDAIVERVLNEGLKVIPTGIKAWDDINGGIPYSSVMLLGAHTSSGKTQMADCLAENFVDYGAKTALVSLEMDIDELTVRRISRASSIDQGKVLLAPTKLSEKEKEKARKLYLDRQKRWDKEGKALYTKIPKGNPSIEELLLQMQPHDFNVIIIDYITLLKDTNGDNQWRKLGDVVAFCKTFCRNNNCIIILLAQITAEQKLRYSATMLEHADLAWFWVKDQTAIDTGVITVNTPKARKQRTISFQLKAEYEYARFTDLPADYKPPEPKDLINPQLKNVVNMPNKKTKGPQDKLMDQFFPVKKKAA